MFYIHKTVFYLTGFPPLKTELSAETIGESFAGPGDTTGMTGDPFATSGETAGRIGEAPDTTDP